MQVSDCQSLRRQMASEGRVFALTSRLAIAAIAPLVLIAVAGCGSEEAPATPATTSIPQVKKEKAPDDPTAKMAHAVTIGKSNVPVDLKYEIASKPIVGTPVEVELALVPSFGADSMSVAFTPSAGLSLSAENAPSFDTPKAGKVERVKLTAMAKDPNVYYITVTATLYSAGTSSPRVFALPLIVGTPTPIEPESAKVSTTKPSKKS